MPTSQFDISWSRAGRYLMSGDELGNQQVIYWLTRSLIIKALASYRATDIGFMVFRSQLTNAKFALPIACPVHHIWHV